MFFEDGACLMSRALPTLRRVRLSLSPNPVSHLIFHPSSRPSLAEPEMIDLNEKPWYEFSDDNNALRVFK